MPFDVTAQNAFEGTLKLGAVFGAYAAAGSIFQDSMSKEALFLFSGGAAVLGNGISCLVNCRPSDEGCCRLDQETVDKVRKFYMRYVGGALSFCIYSAFVSNWDYLKIIGGAFPFLLAFEVASELLGKYIRCCPEREVVQPISSIQEPPPPPYSIISESEVQSRSELANPGSGISEQASRSDESHRESHPNLSSRSLVGEV